MILPADLSWLEPVLLASVVVFFIDLIGNMISFSNRFLNALSTAIVFAIVFGGLSFFLVNGGKLTSLPVPAAAPAPY